MSIFTNSLIFLTWTTLSIIIQHILSLPVKAFIYCNDYCKTIYVDNVDIQSTHNQGVMKLQTVYFNANYGSKLTFTAKNTDGYIGFRSLIKIGDLGELSTNNVSLWSWDSNTKFNSDLYNYQNFWIEGKYYNFLGKLGLVSASNIFSIKIPETAEYVYTYTTSDETLFILEEEMSTINFLQFITPNDGGPVNDLNNTMIFITIPIIGEIQTEEGINVEQGNELVDKVYRYVPNGFSYITSFQYTMSRYNERISNEATITIVVAGRYCVTSTMMYEFCRACRNGYYYKDDIKDQCFDPNNVNDIPENYYCDIQDNRCVPCYETCGSCSKGGNDWEHKCRTCNPNFEYSELKSDGSWNCFEQCPEYWFSYSNGNVKKCVNDCEKTDLPYSDSTNTCWQTCKNGQYLFEGTKFCSSECVDPYVYTIPSAPNLCLIECPFGTTYNEHTRFCMSSLTLLEPSNDLSNSSGNTIEIPWPLQDVIQNIEENIVEYASESITLKGDGFIAQISSISSLPKVEGITSLNFSNSDSNSDSSLGDCEAILRSAYNLTKYESIYIAKFDLERPDYYTNQWEYKVFDNKGNVLDWALCDNVAVSVTYPWVRTEGLDWNYSENMSKHGIDIYNANDLFFNDICYPFQDNGSDITLNDRRNELFSNETFCEDGCEYKGINYETTSVECDCNLKTNFNVEAKNNDDNRHNFFNDLLQGTNLFIVLCYENVLEVSSISHNVGFFIFGAWTSAQFVLTLLLFFNGIPKLWSNANHFANPTKYSLSYLFDKNDKNSSNTFSSIHIINNEPNLSPMVLKPIKNVAVNGNKHKRNNKNVSIDTNSNKTEWSDHSKKTVKRTSKDPKTTREKDEDINQYPFSKAMREDNRNPFILFCSFFSSRWSIYQIIFCPSEFEIFHLSLSLFIFGFSLDLTFNSILFSDDIISEKYHNGGEVNMFTPFILSMLSSVLSMLIMSVISRWVVSFPNLLELCSREVRDRREYIVIIRKVLKQIKTRIIIFQFITIISSLFMWYYITCFCTVFKGSQSNWIYDSIIGVFIGMATSFAVSLLIAALRFIAIKMKLNQWYNISKYIDKSL